jgi:hypothetical protein
LAYRRIITTEQSANNQHIEVEASDQKPIRSRYQRQGLRVKVPAVRQPAG